MISAPQAHSTVPNKGSASLFTDRADRSLQKKLLQQEPSTTLLSSASSPAACTTRAGGCCSVTQLILWTTVKLNSPQDFFRNNEETHPTPLLLFLIQQLRFSFLFILCFKNHLDVKYHECRIVRYQKSHIHHLGLFLYRKQIKVPCPQC